MSYAGPVVKVVAYTGSTAAVTTQVGFRPNVIIGLNMTDGQMWWWTDNTANATSIMKDTASGTAASTETISLTDHGFTVPASGTASNVNTKSYVAICIRSDN